MAIHFDAEAFFAAIDFRLFIHVDAASTFDESFSTRSCTIRNFFALNEMFFGSSTCLKTMVDRSMRR